MNRTGIFLAAAGVLALVALVAGLPRHGERPAAAAVVTTTAPAAAPAVTQGGSLTMTARLSHPYVGAGRTDLFVTVDLEGAEVPGAARAPVNLALVIDRSGSMSGFKLNEAKQAARQLVSQLRATDRLAIVHYGSDVKSLDGLLATEANKARLLEYVDGIWDDGGTNIGAGLTTGRDLLLRSKSDFKVNRLILISDGQPTEGLTEHRALTDLVREIRSHGVGLSSIGVGEDFNEDLMSAFAELGGGAYAYLQDAAQLSAIFQRDLNAAGTQVARGVTLTIKAPAGARLEEVLGYQPAARGLVGGEDALTVALPDFAAGQRERVVARFTVEGAAPGQSVDVSGLTLDYTDLLADRAVRADARLSALVTDKQEEIANHRDRDAVVFAARARSAQNMERANAALREGDKAKAEQLMRQNAFYFEEAAQVAGAPAVAADVKEQQELLDGLKGANDESSVNAYRKGAQKKARVNYGLMGSTY